MGAYSRELLIKKNPIARRVLISDGRLFKSGRKIEHLRYPLYIEQSVHTSQTRNCLFRL